VWILREMCDPFFRNTVLNATAPMNRRVKQGCGSTSAMQRCGVVIRTSQPLWKAERLKAN
jgi:hypothetical protein